jgi:prepilin-type N-terminal cleavage/methylation domain-containing protein
MTPTFHRSNAGFTLTELAVVLAIIALLIGGMLMPLSAQRDVQSRRDTEKALAEIRDALVGYAIINGKLPCPMPLTITDPADANYGFAAATCTPGAEGYLPWKTLGVYEVDSWGSPRSSNAAPFMGYWHYRIDDAFSSAFTLATVPTSGLLIKDTAGNTLTETAPNTPVAVVYSTGANLTADGLNSGTPDTSYQADTPSSTFDDVLIWISRPVLFSRMVAAGKLP